MPEWTDLARLFGELGFPAVMALIVFRAFVVMHAANIKSILGLTQEIHRLTLAIQLQQQWRERAQLPPDFLAQATKYAEEMKAAGLD